MMNQPTGRSAPEPTKLPSLIPPPQLKDAQDSSGKVRTVEAENTIVLTPDLLAKLAADQLLRGFAMSPDRSIDSMPMSIRLDGLDDGLVLEAGEGFGAERSTGRVAKVVMTSHLP